MSAKMNAKKMAVLLASAVLSCSLWSIAPVLAQTPSAKEAMERRTQAQATPPKNDAKNETYDRFMKAIEEDRGSDVAAMLKKGVDPNLVDANGETALMMAARYGSLDAMTALLRAGAQVNKASAIGDTPLMMAAISDKKKAAELLLRNGAEVNRQGWTPLIYAATGGNDDIVELLIDQLADIDARSPNGTTALMMAVRQGNTSTVKLLIDSGANLNLRNETGASAMDWARRGTDSTIVDYLRQAGAK